MQNVGERETMTLSDTFPEPGAAFAGQIPDKPYCSDDLNSGIRPRKKEIALRCRYIQFNGPASYEWLLLDIDRPGAYYASGDANLPPPNVIMVNPENGHAHCAYRLEAPVAKHFNARLKPLQYFTAVLRGYTNRLGADKRYAGLIAKNPLHPAWHTEWCRQKPYSLHEMGDWLFDEDTRYDPRPEVQFGAGRNITLFDELRYFGDREVLAFQRGGDDDSAFKSRLEAVAHGINLQFEVPLRSSEVRSVVRSTAKWISRRFSPKNFEAVQSRRGKAGMAKRWAGKQIAERIEPWKILEISRATFYRQKKLGKCFQRPLLQIVRSLLLLRLSQIHPFSSVTR